MKLHLALSLACLALAGCGTVNPPTGAQLSQARREGEAELPTAVRDKVGATVFLLAATPVEIDWTPMQKGTPGWGAALSNALRPMDPNQTSFGLAFAIDARGFLLTAAHNVENRRFVYLCGRVGGTPTVLQASVVHAGKSTEPGGEFALLRVDRRLPDVLSWGTLPQTSGPLIAASQLVEPVGVNFVAGRFVSCHVADDNPDIRIVETTIPLWKGDSGGPLLDLDGAFVGVNTGGYKGIRLGGKVLVQGRWHGQGISTYPDPNRVALLIQDALKDRSAAEVGGASGRHSDLPSWPSMRAGITRR